MNNNSVVDCHMHVLTKDEFSLYKKTACANKYINIRGLYIDETLNPYNFEEFVDNNDMYFIDSVDLENVDNELKKVEIDLNMYPRIIAIKIYLGYQKYYANDDRVFKIAEFARNHNLAVTFHCGEIYDDNGESSYTPYSDAKYVEELLVKYPNVNFIASHLNWPEFESLFYLCNKYDNFYTCFSGCNDGGSLKEREIQNKVIANTINKYFNEYPSVKSKVMYGTDFFAISDDYNDVSSYIKILDLLEITQEEKKHILYDNVCKAYNVVF